MLTSCCLVIITILVFIFLCFLLVVFLCNVLNVLPSKNYDKRRPLPDK